VLARFGEPCSATPPSVAARLLRGAGGLAEVVRALDAEGIAVENLELHQPTLDDVFLAKTGRSLEGAGEEPEQDPAPAPAGEAVTA
jgi:ABC-2 type transport system ATP-binding protein